MRKRTAVIGLLSFVFIASVSTASAQGRSGGWFGAGGGWGSADLTCDGCGSSESRENSGVVYFNGGYTVTPNVLVGAEFNLWVKSYEDPEFHATTDVKFYNLLGTVTLYPTAGGFFIRGGGGIAFFDMTVKTSGLSAGVDMGKGPAFIVGAGYDIPLGGVALTPAVNYWYASTGDVTFQGETLLTGVKHNVFAVTVGIKFP